MNLNMDQQETYITAPDDASKNVRAAIPPPAQPRVVFPGPMDRDPAARRGLPTRKRGDVSFYGLGLAWRGLHVIGLAIGIVAAWYISAWVHHGRLPLTEPQFKTGFGPYNRILPPEWLLAITGSLVVIALFMLLLGSRDVIPRIRRNKNGEPNIRVDTYFRKSNTTS
jgi:hypothetical protein